MSTAFDFLRRYLHRTTGIVVERGKDYLVESRLKPVAHQHGLDSAEALIERFRYERSESLQRSIVEAMTTNETYFFRDRTPFQLLREVVLPNLIEARKSQRHLRIWCAACSTGQEPYSIAMVLDDEARRLAGWRIDLLATDLSGAALRVAEKGYYSQFEVQRGLPVAQLLRYFTRSGDGWQLAEHLRSRVRFNPLNLLDDFQDLGQFDLIFCRNVLIYFDQRTKQDVLGRLRPSLRRDGYLMLGAAETVLGVSDLWIPYKGNPLLVQPSADVPGKVSQARSHLRLVSNL